MAAPTAAAKRPFAAGSVIWQKKGPLPVWAWAGLVLVVVVGVLYLRSKHQGDTAATTAVGQDIGSLPGNQSAPPVFVVPQPSTPPINIVVPGTGTTVPGTVPDAPPGGGRENPPGTPLPTTAVIPVGANLYDWAAQYYPTLNSGQALNTIRSLNGGQSAFDAMWGNHWVGADGTTKSPIATKTVTVKVR